MAEIPLGEALDSESKRALEIASIVASEQVLQEALAPLKMLDRDLVREVCNILDTTSVTASWIATVVRNLLSLFSGGHPKCEAVGTCADVLTVTHGETVDAPPGAETVLGPPPREGGERLPRQAALAKMVFRCLDCGHTFESKKRRRSCFECKSNNLRQVKR